MSILLRRNRSLPKFAGIASMSLAALLWSSCQMSEPEINEVPPGVPGAPTDVVGVKGNAQVTVSWAAPDSNGGAAITSYTATASPGGATCTTSDSAGTQCVVTGLTNGTAYTFTVTATNAAGTGSASSASAAVTPATFPGAPTAVTLLSFNSTPGTARSGQVEVSWTAPDTNGGIATSYTVTASSGGNSCTAPQNTLNCMVTGLMGGGTYTFKVRATNAIGAGPNSLTSASVTIPATVPDSPESLLLLQDSIANNVRLQFYFGGSSGGSPLINHTVTAIPGGATCQTAALQTAATASCSLSGLENGKAYTLSVVTKNAIGEGAAATLSLPASQILWTTQASGTSLASVTWASTRFVAVGDGGTVTTSSDGTVWTTGTSGTTLDLYGVHWAGEQVIAVGKNGTIMTSPDGVTWTPRQSGTSYNLRAVAWGGSQFVAVGDSGAIVVSPDGEHWETRPSGTKAGLNTVTWFSSRFVSAGIGRILLTSENANQWTIRNPADVSLSILGPTANFKSMASNGGTLFLVGQDDAPVTVCPENTHCRLVPSAKPLVWTSADGTTWIDKSAGIQHQQYLSSVIWTGTSLVAIGRRTNFTSNGMISSNGEAWAPIGIGRFSTTGYAASLNSIAWSGTRAVAVGEKIVTSP